MVKQGFIGQLTLSKLATVRFVAAWGLFEFTLFVCFTSSPQTGVSVPKSMSP